MRTIFPLAILLTASLTVFAADEASTCKRDSNQQELNVCAARKYRAADAALNIKYSEVMARLSVADETSLRREQRAWLKQRDAQCKAKVRQFEGGSIWPLEYYSCLQASTETRTQELGRRQQTER